MEITRLTEDDLPALAGLYREFWGEDSSVEKMRAAFQVIQANADYLILAAKRDGRLVGTALGIVCRGLYGDCRPFMVIEDVVVDRRCRRGGVGSALMRSLEQFAVQRDCSYVLFVTETERGDARQFYAALGYQSEPYRGFKKRLRGEQLTVPRQP